MEEVVVHSEPDEPEKVQVLDRVSSGSDFKFLFKELALISSMRVCVFVCARPHTFRGSTVDGADWPNFQE